MAVRYITKGKGKKRKVFPINPKKKGVSVRSVSLQPRSVAKVNKEQIKLLNKGQTATFSKALNQVVMRARREGIPIYDTRVNMNDKRKAYRMWIVKHPEKGDKIKGSDTIVLAEHYGQAIDDFITVWNKEKRMKRTIGYPQVQGTAEKKFRYRRDGTYFHGGKAYNVELDPSLGIIAVDERFQDDNNVWHTGKNIFFAQGEDGQQIADDAGGFYINTIMDYLDSAGALQT